MNAQAPSRVPEAVTAVVMVGDEILMLHRNPALRAFAGFEAFPGGKVDPGDDQPCVLKTLAGAIPARRVNALARELKEELDFDLAALERDGQVEELSEIGYALTPPHEVRRFSTHFYRLRLKSKPRIRLNTTESPDCGWCTPAGWLERHAAGELLLVPPTQFTLKDLAEDPRRPRLVRLDIIRTFSEAMLEMEPLGGIRILLVRSNTLPPAAHTNCFLIGDGGENAPRLLVDPAPADDTELDRLQQKVTGRFDAILITHHHIDHNERADALARRCRVPIWLSSDTRHRIAGHRPKFFDDVPAVRELRDGETATRWLGHAVNILAVPGHDAGQLALLPDNRAWCLVGDLIQGIGTVVIAPPEGDMATYFDTMEKVIALAPRVIFPSHGLALGGTHYLEAALDHRRMRERQILDLDRSGADEDAILAQVYAGTPAPLLPYARINIRSHLTKLRAESAAG